MTLSGAGGNPLGSLQRPELNQLQQTATDQVAKQGVMLVKDTLEIPFSQFGGNVWKYKSDADRPLLPMYLQVFLGKRDKTPETWGKIFEQLKNELPDGLKAALDRPGARLDPRLKGLLRSLERFAKTLDLLKGATLTISQEEQTKREKYVAASDLSFLEELTRSCKKVVDLLPPSELRRSLVFLLDKAKAIIPAVISKRKKESENEAIFLEIQRTRRELTQSYGEKTPEVFLALLDALEELHHLSYPGANYTLLHNLLRFSTLFGRGDVSLLGPTFREISERLIPEEGHVFVKEQRTLITLLLATTFTFLTFGVGSKDITDSLSLVLFVSEKVLLGAGTALLGGLFLSIPKARALGEDLLALLLGLLLAEQDKQPGIVEVLKRPMTRLLQTIVKRRKGEENPFLQRVLLAVEGRREDELFEFAQEGLKQLGIKEEIWRRDLRALKVFYEFLQMEIEGKGEAGGEMIVIPQSA